MIVRNQSIEEILMSDKPTCQVIQTSKNYDGKQGLNYVDGISAESVGSQGICMMTLTIPPGGHAKAHLHENHETAIYVLSGEGTMWYGDNLSECLTVKAGEFLYIPAGVPHLPANLTDEPVVAVLARTDPNEQESVTLLPELDKFLKFD
jgi:uncharacterized RmlC-like cupin family protein